MNLTQIPTEQTTAVTDLLLSVLAVAAVRFLRQRGPVGLRGTLWRAVFQLLAIAALLGAIAHGVVLGDTGLTLIWRGTYLALALLIAAFFLATIRDLLGDERSRHLVIPASVAALAFFSYIVLEPDSFLPFILYESAVMLFALIAYTWLTWQQRLSGSAWIAASIAVNIIAALIQASGSIRFTAVWSFDHNGAFHLVQMLAIVLLARGLRADAA